MPARAVVTAKFTAGAGLFFHSISDVLDRDGHRRPCGKWLEEVGIPMIAGICITDRVTSCENAASN